VKVSHIDETTLASKTKSTPTISNTVPKPEATEEEKEEERLVMHSQALSTIIHRKKIPALTAYLKEHNLSPDFALHPISTHSHTSTLLHLASASSIATVVSALLSLGANPELTNAAGKTPYEIAGDRSTRDRFRVARHTLGEEKWNWQSAKVAKPLSEAESQERDRREKQEQDLAKAKKLAENKRIADEALKPSSISSNGKDGKGKGAGLGAVGNALRGNSVNDRGMNEEMKTKIERERRARAAEVRFAAVAKK
jgi:hypothetical protein